MNSQVTTRNSQQTVHAGIDIGSLSADAVLLQGGEILAYSVIPTGANSETAAGEVFADVLSRAGLDASGVASIAATGYGRGSVPFASRTITEITCHAVGARHLSPDVATVIDIGGQDSKVIRLGSDGRVEDFSMNDKCAAGTGRFLEVMATALETDLQSLGKLSLASTQQIRISSTCTVFAESEVVSLVARGVPKEDIIRGLHEAVAERIYGMVRRLRAKGPYVMTGGVAKNSGVVQAIESRLKASLYLPPEPQIVGALGAAIMAGIGVRG
jgi:predicted CoA-substrate-specific enzyme activase